MSTIKKSLALIVGSFFIFTFILICFYTGYNLHIDMLYLIARGTGATMKFLLPFLFFPTLRMINAILYRYFVKKLKIPRVNFFFHHRALIHKFFAWVFLSCATIHSLAHFMRSSVALQAVESISGMVMLTAITLPILSMYLIRTHLRNNWFSRFSYYSQFLIPHQIGWTFLMIAFALHNSDLRLLSLSLSIVGIFSFDRLWEWIKSYNVKIINIKKIHEKMIVIKIEKPNHYHYETGQTVYISYPAHAAFFNKVHPFTIASSPKEKSLRFVISDSGEWSRYLIQHLKNGKTIRLSPPFPSPLESKNHDQLCEKLLITSGSGIAMTLSCLYDHPDKSSLHIIHSSRNFEEIALLNKVLNKTNAEVKNVEFYLSDQLKTGILKSGSLKINTRIGRFIPANDPILHSFKGDVYYCGNNALGNEIEKKVLQDPKKSFFREKFN